MHTGVPRAASVIGTPRVPQHGPRRGLEDDVRGGAEPVLVEGVATHRQRVVDTDRLAGDLLPISVDGQVGREVGRLARVEAGRLEVDVLDQQQAGRPDRLDGQGFALGHDQALLVAQPRGRSGGHEEGDQPGVREQGRHLGELVAIAIQEPRARRIGRLANVEPVPSQDRPDRLGRDPVHRGAVGEARVEVGLRLDDPNVALRHATASGSGRACRRRSRRPGRPGQR